MARRGRPPGPGGTKVMTKVRLEPPLIDALKAHAAVLSAQRGGAHVTFSEIVRAACHFYLQTGLNDQPVHYDPQTWART